MPFNSVNDIAAAYESGKWWQSYYLKDLCATINTNYTGKFFDCSFSTGGSIPYSYAYMQANLPLAAHQII